MKKIAKPVLFIHSLPDEFVLPKMTKELFELKQGAKQLKLFEQGEHAQSFNKNPDEYEGTVAEFLMAHDLLMPKPVAGVTQISS